MGRRWRGFLEYITTGFKLPHPLSHNKERKGRKERKMKQGYPPGSRT